MTTHFQRKDRFAYQCNKRETNQCCNNIILLQVKYFVQGSFFPAQATCIQNILQATFEMQAAGFPLNLKNKDTASNKSISISFECRLMSNATKMILSKMILINNIKYGFQCMYQMKVALFDQTLIILQCNYAQILFKTMFRFGSVI